MSSLATMPNTKSFPDCVMINADCLDTLKRMEDKSVSAFIIDPPYGAQTHDQNVWDIAWTSDFWQQIVNECFRVLMKGGHLIVFASGKTIFDIHTKIAMGYKTTFSDDPSFYRMIWKHNSLDSGRVHLHTPRSQFEDILVYFRTGEGKQMFDMGTLKKTYALDQHVGRTNVLEFYKDDCRNKPQPTVKKFFKEHPNNWTFDYKPEGLMRALIRDFTSPGHTVVDFCMRHGMTAVASTLESRKFIGVELEKEAYKRAVSRYSELFSIAAPTRAVMVASPVSSPSTTPVTTDVDSDAESDVMLTPEVHPNMSLPPFEYKDRSWRPIRHHAIVRKLQSLIDKTATEVNYSVNKQAYSARLVQHIDYEIEQTNVETMVSRRIRIPASHTLNTLQEQEKAAKKISTPKPNATTPMTGKTRRNSDSVLEEVPPKRQAVSLEGKIIAVGTPKLVTNLLVFKKMASIDGDQYLVAYPDKINELKAMTICKKFVQGCVGKISKENMKSLGRATMPSRF